MQNIFNQDFQDCIEAFNLHNVEYMLIGGYSVILYGYSRTTGDMDLWVNATRENYILLRNALVDFGIPIDMVTEQMFLDTEIHDVFTFGRPPVQIDILTKVKGMDFDAAYPNAYWFQLEDGLNIKIIARADLITIKEAAGRYRDFDDLNHLRTTEGSE